MRITSELEKKIKVEADKKYKDETTRITEKINTLKTFGENKYVDFAIKASESDEMFRNIFKNIGYASIESNIRSLYNNRLCKEDPTLIDAQKELDEIHNKKTKEIDNLKIQISYEKSFDDVKNAFASNGFEF